MQPPSLATIQRKSAYCSTAQTTSEFQWDIKPRPQKFQSAVGCYIFGYTRADFCYRGVLLRRADAEVTVMVNNR